MYSLVSEYGLVRQRALRVPPPVMLRVPVMPVPPARVGGQGQTSQRQQDQEGEYEHSPPPRG